MTDFRIAFEMGQKAALEAERARSEIDAVFSEVSRQLAEVTEGKLELAKLEFVKQDPNPFVIKIFGPQETYWTVSARNPKAEGSSWKELAIWEQARTGYPCKVIWAGDDHTCHDREALEATLSALLSDPVVGEKLHGLVRLPPKSEAKNSP